MGLSALKLFEKCKTVMRSNHRGVCDRSLQDSLFIPFLDIKVKSYLEVLVGVVDSLLKRIQCRSRLDLVVNLI